MKLKKLLEMMSWNEDDIKAAKNAQPNLDKAVKIHNRLMSSIIPKRKKLQKELTSILNQEYGQGQRGGEVEELKSKIKEIDDKVSVSEDNIKRLTRIRDGILQMKKK